MGISSYVLVGDGESTSQLLEANNVLPLLWLCTITLADIGESLNDSGPTMGLAVAAGYGVSVECEAAIANLKRREETLLPWLSKDAVKMYEQFSHFIGATTASHIRLDLAEWVDAYNSVDEASAELRAILAALDTPPPKTQPPTRKPKAIKWLFNHYEFASLNRNLPNLAYALGGTSFEVREPWRREPPRDRRLPDDALRWSNSSLNVSANGQTIVVKVKNDAHLETTIIWSRLTNSCAAVPVDDAIEHMHVNFVSGDGGVLFGTGTRFPGPLPFAFRYENGRLETCSDAARPSAISYASSDDGTVAVGFMSSGKYGDGSDRAFYWRAGQAPVCFLGNELTSDARHITPDGRYIAGTCVVPDGSGGERERAFVWNEADGATVVCEDCRAKWIALGPDGDCGVLETLDVPRGVGNHMYWRKGEALRPIADANGNPLPLMRISAAVDAVLANGVDENGVAGGLVLWRPDQPVLTIAAPAGGTLDAQYVSPGGKTVVAIFHQNRVACEMLIWREQGALSRHPIEHRSSVHDAGIWERNRSAAPEDFVALGHDWDFTPYIWTAEGGVEFCPCDVTLARAKSFDDHRY